MLVTPPSHGRPWFLALRSIDQSWWLSMVISLALVIGVVRANHLLTPGANAGLIAYTSGMSGGVSAPVFSLVHHRPMEVCETYYATKTASLRHLGDRWSGVTDAGRIGGVFGDYHAASRALLSQPCSGDWVWQPGSLSGHLYAQFARDTAPAWLFERFGVTDAEIALLLLSGALLGAFGVAQLFFGLARSNVLLLCAVVYFATVSAWLTTSFGFLTLKAFYGFSTAWLVTVLAGAGPRRSIALWVVISLALAINLVGYLSISYSAAFLTVGIALLSTGAAVMARPTGSSVLALVAVVAMVGLGLRDCASFAKRRLAPVSVLNFASAGSFGEFALTTGFWTERPNPWSYPLGDLGVRVAMSAEPLIEEYAPATFEYQGFAQVGRDMLREMLFTHPLTFVESLGKRAALFVVKLPVIGAGIEDRTPGLLRIVSVVRVVAGALTMGALVSRTAWSLELPALVIMTWSFFGIELLTHLVHTHVNYFIVGIMELLIGVPLLLVIAVSQIRRVMRSGVAMSADQRRKARRGLLAAGLIVVALTPYGVRQFRRELATFDIWYGPWLGVYEAHPVRDALLPDRIAAKVEHLRTLGESDPGTISMYAAWTMVRLVANIWGSPEMAGTRFGMNAAEVATERLRSNELAIAYFRRAQAEAPDSQWAAVFAPIVDPPTAIRLSARALERNPDGVFAASLAHFLTYNVAGHPYGAMFDALSHRRMVRSADLRPGFVEVPPVEAIADGEASVSPREVLIRLKPGGTVTVGPFRGYNSDRVKALLFVAIQTGSVDGRLLLRTRTTTIETPARILPERAATSYRFFEWNGRESIDAGVIRLRAGAMGASMTVKDLYPLIENGRDVE